MWILTLTDRKYAIIWFWLCSGFQENPEGKYQLEFKGPVLTLIGPYTIEGRVLLLPIQGTGASNITIGRRTSYRWRRLSKHFSYEFLVDPNLKVTFTGKTKTRKGKVYLQTDDLKYTFTTSR